MKHYSPESTKEVENLKRSQRAARDISFNNRIKGTYDFIFTICFINSRLYKRP